MNNINKTENANKQELLNQAITNWGLEDPGTIELHMMAKVNTYVEMLAYYDLYISAMATDWGF